MMRSRRTLFMMLIVSGPVLVALLARPADGRGGELFGMIVSLLFLRFSVPALAVLYGASLIADEVEEKTITYLFLRPIPRGAILVGKYVSYMTCTTAVVWSSVLAVYWALFPRDELASRAGHLVTDLAVLGLGLAVYGALFASMGAILKRPLVIGLLFAFGWEQAALILPGYLRQLAITYHLQALLPHPAPSQGIMSLLQITAREPQSAGLSLLWLLMALASFLVLGAQAVARREYVLDE
jgi:ABC-type transport system involved in multi-copper enzyme maturation permease subunit